MKRSIWLSIALLMAGSTLADDGAMFRKNVSGTPEYDTEYVSLRMLPVFVPVQSSGGELLGSIDYLNADGAIAETVEYVQPLMESYQDGPVTHIEEYEAFPGHGARDSYVAVSLDGGNSWKRTNVSNSARRSSVKIDRKPYPGDTLRNFLASDGNKVLFVWASKYCGSGSPAYSMTDDERLALATYLAETGTIADAAACTDGDLSTPCTYLEDAFAVAGSQGVQDAKELAEDGYPLVGDYPYSCLWAARGVLLPPAAAGETSTFVWFKAERLTSGVRSAERSEAVCVKGAGCAVTWQEDPEGVRPGHGDGPGEGWSGAIAHHQTDTWYSFIDWSDFDLVTGDGTYGTFYGTDLVTSGATLAEWVAANPTGSPKAAIPMAIPMRVTDNAMCTAMTGTDLNLESKPYCYIDFDGSGTADFCASVVSITIETPEGPTQDVDMCVTEDGRLMRGNTASTRARLSLHGYSTLGDYKADPAAYPIDSAWVSFSYEENKGLGDVCDDGDCEDQDMTDADKKDMGKNIWYHTFDMFHPELVSQGMMLNQPEVYPADWSDPTGLLDQDTSLGYNFWTFTEDPIYNTLAGITTTTLYQTEIARRASQVTQDWYDAGSQGLVAFNLWKQGIIRRGGPADAMGRRWVIPEDFDPAIDNPYDYYNMVCENADGTSAWAFRELNEDGAPVNPRYTKGFCAAPAINLSANTILEGECGDATTCFEAFPFNDYFDDLDMEDSTGISKILTWEQYGPSLGEDLDTTFEDDPETNFDDQSWANPYDMAKGHRGFLAGDMVMIMYAWTNNWSALTEAHDIVNLYARRSFDGGQTFTTLPASYTHTNGITYSGDGTTTCEFQGETGTATELPVCYTYLAGEFEQSRDLSLLTGSTVTVLDPRYAPTTRSVTIASVSTASLPLGFDLFVPECTDTTQDACDNLRDPSRFHMVYETGITSAYDEGEAEALDLFYSRAVDWGDAYLVWAEEDDTSACLPDADTDAENLLAGTGVCNEFDGLESSKFATASEAALVSSPGGKLLNAAWFQEDFDHRTGEELGIDAWYRRILYIADYIPGEDDPSGPGNNAPGAAFSYAIEDLTVSFTDTSTDSDGEVVAWLWDFGDGVTSAERNPTHTYAGGGTYTVVLTVTDDFGATGTAPADITVAAPPVVTISLTATSSVKGSKAYANLTWSGATTSNVDVRRNGEVVATTPNDGAYTDSLGKGVAGTFSYRICEAGSTDHCSTEASVTF